MFNPPPEGQIRPYLSYCDFLCNCELNDRLYKHSGMFLFLIWCALPLKVAAKQLDHAWQKRTNLFCCSRARNAAYNLVREYDALKVTVTFWLVYTAERSARCFLFFFRCRFCIFHSLQCNYVVLSYNPDLRERGCLVQVKIPLTIK